MTAFTCNMPPAIAELLRQGGTVHIVEDRAVMPAVTQSSGSLPPLPKRKSLGRSKKQLLRAHSRPCRWANHNDSCSSLNNNNSNSSLPSLMEVEDACSASDQEQGAAAPMQAIFTPTAPTTCAPKKPMRRQSVEHQSRAEYERQQQQSCLTKTLESAKDLDDDTLPTVDESSSLSEDSFNMHDSFSSRTEHAQQLATQCQRFGLQW